ncbi:uncharacterized protein LOC124167107 [Ischnura elegans]|uniref:uncharacterized protein LOC124167107 n=1 Tax=Ischnura elegans TaxID=197161 RepID=UPI001ED879EE|nr:uncharacterized protein LOC124167107 [Ischnura elegans]
MGLDTSATTKRQLKSRRRPRQFRYLEFISQFTTDIRHVAGAENVVADALSRVEEVSAAVPHSTLASAQEDDPELKALIDYNNSSLVFRKISLPDTGMEVYCDISTSTARPFVPSDLRRQVFESLHSLSHPGIKASAKLVSERFVWPSLKKDCRNWARECVACQRSKVTRHVTSPVGKFSVPGSCFEHIHLQIVGPLPFSRGYKYCLTVIDRFTRWPEAIPLQDITAETVARAFFLGWIARYGTPSRITTDQGRQFESRLFNQLSRLCGATHFRTAAYNPAANGMVERFHRQLKAAIRCHSTLSWVDVLPGILLGIRARWKDDIACTAAEMVFGEPLRLPGEFLCPSPHTTMEDQTEFLVLQRREKDYLVRIRGRDVWVAINRLKPAFVVNKDAESGADATIEDSDLFVLPEPARGRPEAAGRTPRPSTEDRMIQPRPAPVRRDAADQPPPPPAPRTTRSGRRVRFPAHLADYIT